MEEYKIYVKQWTTVIVSQIYNIYIFISSKGTTLQKINISNTPSHYPASAFADHQKTGALVSAF